MHLIYKYTNSINGKVYIGQTSRTMEERAQSGGKNYRECRRFYNAILKYSWDAFIPEVLESVNTVEEANKLEAYYIKHYNSTDERYGYNISVGGGNGTMSDETRLLISKKAIERYADRTANPMYGRKHTAKTILLQSEKKVGCNNPMYGTKWNETQREKSGCRGKCLNITDERRNVLREHCRKLGRTVGLRPVRCIEDDVEFKSIVDAAVAYGISKSTLCGHLTGKQKSCRGKHFEYKA